MKTTRSCLSFQMTPHRHVTSHVTESSQHCVCTAARDSGAAAEHWDPALPGPACAKAGLDKLGVGHLPQPHLACKHHVQGSCCWLSPPVLPHVLLLGDAAAGCFDAREGQIRVSAHDCGVVARPRQVPATEDCVSHPPCHMALRVRLCRQGVPRHPRNLNIPRHTVSRPGTAPFPSSSCPLCVLELDNTDPVCVCVCAVRAGQQEHAACGRPHAAAARHLHGMQRQHVAD